MGVTWAVVSCLTIRRIRRHLKKWSYQSTGNNENDSWRITWNQLESDQPQSQIHLEREDTAFWRRTPNERDAMIRNQNRRTLLEIQLEAPLWWWFCALDNGHQLIKSARLSENWMANLRGQAIQGALKMRIPFQTERSVLEVDKIYKWTVWFRYDSSTGANRQTTCKLRVATYRRSSDNERSNEWAFKCRCTNTTKQIGLSGSKRIFSD